MNRIHQISQILLEYCKNIQEFWQNCPDWIGVLILIFIGMFFLKRYLDV